MNGVLESEKSEYRGSSEALSGARFGEGLKIPAKLRLTPPPRLATVAGMFKDFRQVVVVVIVLLGDAVGACRI
jgi:hypothetical protein